MAGLHDLHVYPSLPGDATSFVPVCGAGYRVTGDGPLQSKQYILIRLGLPALMGMTSVIEIGIVDFTSPHHVAHLFAVGPTGLCTRFPG